MMETFMNKKAILLALLALEGGRAAAQGNVTIFGTVDEFIELGNNGRNHVTRLQSGGIWGSRIGFKGSEDLGGGTKAIFTLETGTNADDGSLGQGGLLFGRQAFVGLSGNGGTLTFGRHYSPTFITMATYGLGGGMGWGNASVNFTDLTVLRANNSINYVSPALRGLTAKLFYALGENTTPGQGHVGDQAGGTLQYDNGPVSANLTYVERKATMTNTDRWWTGGLSYDFRWAMMGAVLQKRGDDAGTARTTFVELSTTIPLGTGSLLLDVGALRNDAIAHANARHYGARYDYYLSKRSNLYAGLVQVRNQRRTSVTINGASSPGMSVAPGDDPRAMALGIRHLF
jgi:predicted porin